MTENPEDLCNRAERICAIAVEPFIDAAVIDAPTVHAMRVLCERVLAALSPDVPLQLFIEPHHEIPSALELCVTRK